MYSCGCGSQEEYHSLTLPLRPGNQGILFEKIPIHLPAKHNSSKIIIIIHSSYEPCFLSPDTVKLSSMNQVFSHWFNYGDRERK